MKNIILLFFSKKKNPIFPSILYLQKPSSYQGFARSYYLDDIVFRSY